MRIFAYVELQQYGLGRIHSSSRPASDFTLKYCSNSGRSQRAVPRCMSQAMSKPHLRDNRTIVVGTIYLARSFPSSTESYHVYETKTKEGFFCAANVSGHKKITCSNSEKLYTAPLPHRPPSFRDTRCTPPLLLWRRNRPRKASDLMCPPHKSSRRGTCLNTLGRVSPWRYRRCPRGTVFERRLGSSSQPRIAPVNER